MEITQEQEHIMDLIADMWTENFMMKLNIDEHEEFGSLNAKWTITSIFLSGIKMGFNIHNSLNTTTTSPNP